MSSDIEWTDETWNPVVGCTPVSPGCLNCYAATMAPRLAAMGQSVYVGLTVKRLLSANSLNDGELLETGIGRHRHVFNGTVRMLPERLTDPLHWNKPRMVFVNSMSDLFHKDVSFGFIMHVFAIMAMCPQHTFQILTKRPERMFEFLKLLEKAAQNWSPMTATGEFTPTQELNLRFAQACRGHGPWRPFGNVKWPLPNVWLGTSVEDQQRADERIPWLLKCPAAVRFLSCEPLLGMINLKEVELGMEHHVMHNPMNTYHINCLTDRDDEHFFNDHKQVDWVIVGGESGGLSRRTGVHFINTIVRQCQEHDVPVFVKQVGAHPMVRNDCLDEWPGVDGPGLRFRNQPKQPQHQGELVELQLKHRKGGKMEEWPERLRLREMPEVVA